VKKRRARGTLKKKLTTVEREKQQGARYLNKKDESAQARAVLKSRRHSGLRRYKFTKLISNINP